MGNREGAQTGSRVCIYILAQKLDKQSNICKLGISPSPDQMIVRLRPVFSLPSVPAA